MSTVNEMMPNPAVNPDLPQKARQAGYLERWASQRIHNDR